MSEDLVSEVLFSVGALAHGKIPTPALLALAAGNGEGNNDALAFSKVTVHARSHLNDLAHHLVAHDVARQHRGNEIVEQMQVGPADRAACHFHDGVTLILNLG